MSDKPRIDWVPEMGEDIRQPSPDEWKCIMCGLDGKGGIDTILAHVAQCPAMTAIMSQMATDAKTCSCPRCTARRKAERQVRAVKVILAGLVLWCLASIGVVTYLVASR